MKLSKGFLERSAKSIGVLLLLLSAASCSESARGTQSMGESKFVDVDGIRTRYFEGGSGEAMVLVHGGHYGATGGAVWWKPAFPKLAANFNVYAVDKLLDARRRQPLKRQMAQRRADARFDVPGIHAVRRPFHRCLHAVCQPAIEDFGNALPAVADILTCKRRCGCVAGGGEKVRHRNQIKSRRVAGVNSPIFVCVWIAVV